VSTVAINSSYLTGRQRDHFQSGI